MDRETLLTASPSEIFDGALESRRALRKAYAELIRQYGPERDPECFRRIRDAYEELSSHFDAPGTAPVQVESRARAGGSDVAGVIERCRRLIDEQRSLEALELLDQHEASVRTEQPQAWFRLMVSAMYDACDDVPTARITRAFDDLDDPQFDVDEKAYFDIAAHWTAAQAWAAARQDEQLPAPFRNAMGHPRGATRLALARRWHAVLSELSEDAFVEAYRRVVLVHPGLLPALYHIENRITGVDDFTEKWEFGVPQVDVPAAHAEEVKSLRKLRQLIAMPSLATRKLQNPVIAAVVALFVANLFLPKSWQDAGIAGIMAVTVGLAALHQRVQSPQATLRRMTELERRLRELVSTSGFFRHELLAILVERRQPEHIEVGHGFFGPGMLDPLTTLAEVPQTELALLSAAQLARIEREEQAKAAVQP